MTGTEKTSAPIVVTDDPFVGHAENASRLIVAKDDLVTNPAGAADLRCGAHILGSVEQTMDYVLAHGIYVPRHISAPLKPPGSGLPAVGHLDTGLISRRRRAA